MFQNSQFTYLKKNASFIEFRHLEKLLTTKETEKRSNWIARRQNDLIQQSKWNHNKPPRYMRDTNASKSIKLNRILLPRFIGGIVGGSAVVRSVVGAGISEITLTYYNEGKKLCIKDRNGWWRKLYLRVWWRRPSRLESSWPRICTSRSPKGRRSGSSASCTSCSRCPWTRPRTCHLNAMYTSNW